MDNFYVTERSPSRLPSRKTPKERDMAQQQVSNSLLEKDLLRPLQFFENFIRNLLSVLKSILISVNLNF